MKLQKLLFGAAAALFLPLSMAQEAQAEAPETYHYEVRPFPDLHLHFIASSPVP